MHCAALLFTAFFRLLDGIVTGFCNIRVRWIPSVRADGGSVPYMWVDLFGLVM
jgi:hypothetical protein